MATFTVDMSDELFAALEIVAAHEGHASVSEFVECNLKLWVGQRAFGLFSVEQVRNSIEESRGAPVTYSANKIFDRVDARLQVLIAEAEADLAAGRLVEFDLDTIAHHAAASSSPK